ncbi:MAG TPA: hypothetical protein VFI96_09195 [Longimicrobiaceae bacterium]|nr:hypothetical protein [Longimicrobiaceae bacterium]
MNTESRAEIAEARIVYVQEPDSCASADAPQTLTVEAVDAGGGHYLVLSTERWACETPDEMAAMLRRVLEIVENTHPRDEP